jgi:hypothetical protein
MKFPKPTIPLTGDGRRPTSEGTSDAQWWLGSRKGLFLARQIARSCRPISNPPCCTQGGQGRAKVALLIVSLSQTRLARLTLSRLAFNDPPCCASKLPGWHMPNGSHPGFFQRSLRARALT